MARLTWTRLVRAVVLGVLVLGLTGARAWAHPIHTTLTLISLDPSGRVITFRIRAFADDFSASVARYAGRTPPADSSAPSADVVRYVRGTVTVIDGGGKAATLEPCGVERARELYWICVRVQLPNGTRGARVRNLMLSELHPDQVNIVQLERGGSRKTMLFTRGASPAPLP